MASATASALANAARANLVAGAGGFTPLLLRGTRFLARAGAGAGGASAAPSGVGFAWPTSGCRAAMRGATSAAPGRAGPRRAVRGVAAATGRRDRAGMRVCVECVLKRRGGGAELSLCLRRPGRALSLSLFFILSIGNVSLFPGTPCTAHAPLVHQRASHTSSRTFSRAPACRTRALSPLFILHLCLTLLRRRPHPRPTTTPPAPASSPSLCAACGAARACRCVCVCRRERE